MLCLTRKNRNLSPGENSQVDPKAEMNGAFLNPNTGSKGSGWNIPVGPARILNFSFSQVVL